MSTFARFFLLCCAILVCPNLMLSAQSTVSDTSKNVHRSNSPRFDRSNRRQLLPKRSYGMPPPMYYGHFNSGDAPKLYRYNTETGLFYGTFDTNARGWGGLYALRSNIGNTSPYRGQYPTRDPGKVGKCPPAVRARVCIYRCSPTGRFGPTVCDIESL